MITGYELIEKMYSENYDDEYEDTRLYSTGDDELDDLLERAFCEGYEYAQKEFGRTGKSAGQAKMWFEGGNGKLNRQLKKLDEASKGAELILRGKNERKKDILKADKTNFKGFNYGKTRSERDGRSLLNATSIGRRFRDIDAESGMRIDNEINANARGFGAVPMKYNEILYKKFKK